ncbi:hypothetical protein BDZ94DRAFT_1323128 [Collybia nuda]|uniref:FHA domain-containing protein n=1 Tax=Collybia nuda TaxID=64659 RepID=A0A9P5Y1P3_9AGAR|nr:hypothetical protein BDZ94DRAFT_1323128 [Collybia nuda]
MDSSGFSQIGRYGTICLMKRHEPDTVVTSFGIDTEELTFGRDPTCGVRLYYSDVSLVHCRIVFEERKAFLIVLGANGLVVDGCKVYPNGSPSGSGSPMTIPLTNNSEFEIHGKRFRFAYPPKELRAALFATPARPPQRKLRLSMIHSAQVFSPRPSKDPRENLRILQSPLKNAFKTPGKSGSSSPVRTNLLSTTPTRNDPDEEEADDIVLVDGNHPRVVEDEKDLVILEDVQLPDAGSQSMPVQQQHLQPPPQTPVRKRSLSRNTLHRAVLIRSAQRAVLEAEHAEREREAEEEEEMEVFETVASDAASESEGEGEEEEDDDKMGSDGTEENDDSESDEEVEEYEEEVRGREDERGSTAQKSTWRKSLERIWPFRSSSAPVEDEEQDVCFRGDSGKKNPLTVMKQDANSASNSDNDNEEEDQENVDVPAPLPAALQAATPVRRGLGSFMTPQPRPRIFGGSEQPPPPDDTDAKGGRYSLGGEARRVVRTDQVWKVRDIIVPLAGASAAGRGAAPTALPVAARPIVGEEERKAIQERRRSALREVDTFFGGGVPGMGASPGKGQGWSPAKAMTSSASSSSAAGTASSGGSPFKSSSPMKPTALFRRDDDSDGSEEMDTRSLLERMKETVEGMKRRRSLAPAGAGTPVTPARDARLGVARPGTVSPSKSVAPTMMDVAEEEDDKENVAGIEWGVDVEEHKVEELFSLLRPGVLEEVRAREEERVVEVEEELLRDDVYVEETETAAEQTNAVEVPVVVVEVPADEGLTPPVDGFSSAEDDASDEPAPKKSGRARLLRAKKPTPVPEEPVEQPEPKSKLISSRKAKTPSTKPASEEAAQNGSEEEQTPDEPVEAPKTTTRRGRKAAIGATEEAEAGPPPARRTRKATAEPEEPIVAPTAKRGRKATVEPEDPASKEETTIPIPVRRGRKPAAVVPVPTEVPEEADSATPLLASLKRSVRKTPAPAEAEGVDEAPAPVRRGRAPRTAPSALPVRRPALKKSDEAAGAASGSGGVKRGTRTKPIDVEAVDDGGNDPLDSLDAEESEAVVAKPRGRKRVVKVEVVDDKIPVPTTRGAKAKAPAAKTPAAKPRVKKVPATAPAAVQDVDKENTPGSEESSVADGDEPVKIRVSRTTRKGTTTARTTKIKQEDVEHPESTPPEPEVTRGRSVRATRTRART